MVGRSRSRFSLGLLAAGLAALVAVAACDVSDTAAMALIDQADGQTTPVRTDLRVKLPDTCKWTGNTTGPGRQSLALLIGINDYAYEKVRDLEGAVNDVEVMREILTDPKGAYRLKPEHVCLLTDAQATTAHVLTAYKSFLFDRVDADDHVTIYFAGHGGQVTDTDELEPDGRDETLVLQDAMVPVAQTAPGQLARAPHLTDDALGLLLDALNEKLTAGSPGRHGLTVILDSCNSLSATRGSLRARFFDSELGVHFAPLSKAFRDAGLEEIAAKLDTPDAERERGSLAPPGAVVISASGDGTVAWESGSRGIFSTAFGAALAGVTEPISYRQLEWRVRAALKSAHQVPAFHGDLDRQVLGSDTIGSGAPHIVRDVEGKTVKLAGIPVPGFGPGAEFRIYSGATAEGFNDVSKAKATLKVINSDPLHVEAETVEIAQGAKIEPGDKAILISASPSARKLNVAIAANVPADVRDAILAQAKLDSDIERGVDFSVPESGDYDLRIVALPSGESGMRALAFVDPDGNVRYKSSKPDSATDIATQSGNFARQKSLRLLQGEGGDALRDNRSISVSLMPYSGPDNRTRCKSDFQPFGAPTRTGENIWDVPMCARYYFRVEATDIQEEVQIGILYLSSDGNTYSIPNKDLSSAEAQKFRLTPNTPEQPGSLVLDFDGNPYQAFPPIGADDEVLVFAVQAKTPIPWHRLVGNARTRSAATVQNSLYRELSRYQSGQTRTGAPLSEGPTAPDPWSVTRITIRQVANPDFKPASGAPIGAASAKREYTIPDFNIEPYLPADTNSALFRVLQKAHELSTKSANFSPVGASEESDGYPYKQHDWCAKDADGNIDYDANLNIGIDCSRSIWYAFTQAGLDYHGKVKASDARKACLPYGAPGNDYLTTADMAKSSSPMAANFDSCTGQDLKIGDLLVYRREGGSDGHVVMVIDPDKRIAWGSHGWDGNPKLGLPKDNGVEYQKIKLKKDWERWDSSNMKLKACWRHKKFTEDRQKPYFELSGAYWESVLCDTPGRCTVNASAPGSSTQP